MITESELRELPLKYLEQISQFMYPDEGEKNQSDYKEKLVHIKRSIEAILDPVQSHVVLSDELHKIFVSIQSYLDWLIAN